jgi:hypothetical protein
MVGRKKGIRARLEEQAPCAASIESFGLCPVFENAAVPNPCFAPAVDWQVGLQEPEGNVFRVGAKVAA